jgi:CDP-diacylglycerol--glycerol-3-phosphate 3-phosphatidyltransferase
MQSDKPEKKGKIQTFSDFLRTTFSIPLNFFAKIFMKLGFLPNHLTVMGLVGSAVGAYFVAIGKFTIGGLIILAMGSFDVLDGALARMMDKKDPFGPMLDSVADRYIDIFIFGGLLYYYAENENLLFILLCFFALSGSLMVSYSRARADSLGIEVKIGIFTRAERFFIIVPSIFFNVPHIGLWILAIGTNFTAVRRILYTRKELQNKDHGE